MGRNKQLKKMIEGLQKAKEEHLKKIKEYDGDKDYIIEYWEREIENIDNQKRDSERKMKK